VISAIRPSAGAKEVSAVDALALNTIMVLVATRVDRVRVDFRPSATNVSVINSTKRQYGVMFHVCAESSREPISVELCMTLVFIRAG